MSEPPRSGFRLSPARGPDATGAAGQTAARCGKRRVPAVESRTCLCGHRARASAGNSLRLAALRVCLTRGARRLRPTPSSGFRGCCPDIPALQPLRSRERGFVRSHSLRPLPAPRDAEAIGPCDPPVNRVCGVPGRELYCSVLGILELLGRNLGDQHPGAPGPSSP